MYVNSWLQLHPALIRVKLLLSSCLGSWEGNDGITNEKHAWIGWTYTNASTTHRGGNSTISSRLKTYRKSSRDCNVSPTSSFRIALHAPCIQGHSKRTTLRQPRSNKWPWIHGSCLCQSCPSKRRSLGVKMRTEAAMSVGRVLQKLGQFLKNSKSKMPATEFHAEIKHFKNCEVFGILQNPWATSETRQPGPLHRSKSCNSKKHRPVWSLNLGYTRFVAKFALKSGKFAVLIQPSVDGGRIVNRSFSGVTVSAKKQKQCSMQSCFHLQLCFCAENRTTPIQLDRPVAIFPWSSMCANMIIFNIFNITANRTWIFHQHIILFQSLVALPLARVTFAGVPDTLRCFSLFIFQISSFNDLSGVSFRVLELVRAKMTTCLYSQFCDVCI